MRIIRKINRQRGVSLAEYVIMVSVATAAIFMVLFEVQHSIQGGVIAMSNKFIGKGSGNRLMPYHRYGGKQFVDPTLFYSVTGDTGISKQVNISSDELGGGARKVEIKETETLQSPGSKVTLPSYNLSSPSDFKWKDRRKLPEYVPSLVKAEEGYVKPLSRGE